MISAYSNNSELHEYFYQNSRSIQDISSEKITEILQHGAWKITGQSITSAETNNDTNPAPLYDQISRGDNAAGVNAFADIHFDKNVKSILDVGGGKYDVCRNYMRTKNIELLVWDPYNRSKENNDSVKLAVTKHKVDAATSMAVLNVIPDVETRLEHIVTLKQALKINGYAYFKIWPGEGNLKGANKAIVNAYGYPGYQANAYAVKFLPEVQLVFGVKNVRLDPKVPNLIIAKKVDYPSDVKNFNF
jgi:hypothetical protein